MAKMIGPPRLVRRGRKPIYPRVLTVPEAAAILRSSYEGVRKLLKRGELLGFRQGIQWRTTDLAILAFMGFPSPGFPYRMPKPVKAGLNYGNQMQAVIRRNGGTEEEVREAYRKRSEARKSLRAGKRTLVLGDPAVGAGDGAQRSGPVAGEGPANG